MVESNKEWRSVAQRAEEYQLQHAQMVDYVVLVGGLMAVYFASPSDFLSGSMLLMASFCFVFGFKGEAGILESWKA